MRFELFLRDIDDGRLSMNENFPNYKFSYGFFMKTSHVHTGCVWVDLRVGLEPRMSAIFNQISGDL